MSVGSVLFFFQILRISCGNENISLNGKGGGSSDLFTTARWNLESSFVLEQTRSFTLRAPGVRAYVNIIHPIRDTTYFSSSYLLVAFSLSLKLFLISFLTSFFRCQL